MMLDNLELRELLQIGDCGEHRNGDSKINPKTCKFIIFIRFFELFINLLLVNFWRQTMIGFNILKQVIRP